MAASITTVSASTTSASACALDETRDALYIANNTSVTAYCRIGGGTASSSAFSFVLPAGTTWEAPSAVKSQAVSVVLASGTGNILVTEVS